MAESFSRWESDPLFSAAEVVQDSADRLESVHRTLLHEQLLAQEDPSDAKLLSSLQFHRRDLTTSLETTRWQLEDFEREVNLAALSDESKSREIAILKHKQFVRAIKEQILQVESSMQDLSKEDHRRNPQWMTLNEQDKEMLTSFLSGGNFRDQSSNYDSGSSIMTRFLDSNTDNDEIIELKPEESELLATNGRQNADNAYDYSRNHMSCKMGSHKPRINGPALFQGSGGPQELEKPGFYDLECGRLGAKSHSYHNRIRGSAWGFLRNFWLGNNTKGSFMKKRKDGEITDIMENAEQKMSFSSGITPSDRQGTILECLVSAMQFYKCTRRFRTSQYLKSYNQFHVRMSVVLVILIIVGFLMFRTAWMYMF